MDDATLIHRAGEGDESAFAEFYDLYAARTLGLLVRLSPTRAEAEELLQEVMLQVWKQASRYDPQRGSVLAWLFTMARSRAYDALRVRKPSASSDRHPEPETTNTPNDDLIRADEHDGLHAALGKLPKDQREMVQLSFFSGLTHIQIAERLGVPLGTVKTRIRRGMLAMRDELSRREGVTL